jgi:hypothetical protein
MGWRARMLLGTAWEVAKTLAALAATAALVAYSFGWNP